MLTAIAVSPFFRWGLGGEENTLNLEHVLGTVRISICSTKIDSVAVSGAPSCNRVPHFPTPTWPTLQPKFDLFVFGEAFMISGYSSAWDEQLRMQHVELPKMKSDPSWQFESSIIEEYKKSSIPDMPEAVQAPHFQLPPFPPFPVPRHDRLTWSGTFSFPALSAMSARSIASTVEKQEEETDEKRKPAGFEIWI